MKRLFLLFFLLLFVVGCSNQNKDTNKNNTTGDTAKQESKGILYKYNIENFDYSLLKEKIYKYEGDKENMEIALYDDHSLSYDYSFVTAEYYNKTTWDSYRTGRSLYYKIDGDKLIISGKFYYVSDNPWNGIASNNSSIVDKEVALTIVDNYKYLKDDKNTYENLMYTLYKDSDIQEFYINPDTGLTYYINNGEPISLCKLYEVKYSKLNCGFNKSLSGKKIDVKDYEVIDMTQSESKKKNSKSNNLYFNDLTVFTRNYKDFSDTGYDYRSWVYYVVNLSKDKTCQMRTPFTFLYNGEEELIDNRNYTNCKYEMKDIDNYILLTVSVDITNEQYMDKAKFYYKIKSNKNNCISSIDSIYTIEPSSYSYAYEKGQWFNFKDGNICLQSK